MARVAYLIKVTGDNNNKYYNMHEEDGVLRVEYGRVGVTKTQKTYDIRKWDSIYRTRIRHGYTDVTHLHSTISDTSDFAQIQEPTIAKLISDLRNYSHQGIHQSYTVSSEAVTQSQVDTAQEILDRLADTKKILAFNDLLLELYQTIPRRMNHVSDFLIEDKKGRQDALTREQKTLDVMRTEVKTDLSKTEKHGTILEVMGLEIVAVTAQELAEIKRLLRGWQRIGNVYKVVNVKTQERFCRKVGERQNLFHGSRNQNWLNILDDGLVIRPTAANGSMFGRGLYFADNPEKSINYTSYWGSNRGFLAVFEVWLGNPLHIHTWANRHYKLPNLPEMQGHDSVFAHSGQSLRNNEYIVYQNEHATIKYLIELRS